MQIFHEVSVVFYLEKNSVQFVSEEPWHGGAPRAAVRGVAARERCRGEKLLFFF
jgi:hypothetical protein